MPTITALTPNSGLTGGRVLIAITGTNFKLPDPPPPTGRVPPQLPSVQVAFGGVVSANAFAVSPTRLFALVPPGVPKVVSPGVVGVNAVDVAVQNMTSAGAPIAGELATAAAAYTYRMPDLTAPTTLQRVVRQVRQMISREVIDNVSLTVHTEYDADTRDNLSIIDVGKLPAIVLIGPDTPANRFYSTNTRRQVVNPDGTVSTLRTSVTVDLTFTLACASNSMVELLNLQSLVRQFFERNLLVTILRDPNDASKGTVSYELAAPFDGYAATNKPSDSNVRQFSGPFMIRGVDLDEDSLVVDVSMPVVDYVPNGAPTYTVVEASRLSAWPVILGASTSGPVTPTTTPQAVDFEQYLPGDKP